MNEPMLHLSLVQWLLLFGITLLVIEVAFLGFATFILFFIGSAMVIVAALMSVDVLTSDPQTAVIAVTLGTVVIASLSWRFLKNIQKSPQNQNVEVGFVGHQFRLKSDISPNAPGVYNYSGVAWRVIPDEKIAKNVLLEVTQADVGVLTVTAAKSADEG
jgi:membrane protein implicated in regulation of membrane protease activity